MMAKADDGYRLVLFDAPDDPQAVRDLLCRVTGIHPTDAMRWVAHSPGVWPRPLSEIEARDLLDGLYEQGVAAEARRADLFPNLSPPRTIHGAACLPEGFRVTGLRGEPTHWVPWDKIELIAAGKVEMEDEFRDVSPPTWIVAVSTGLNALLRRPQMIARRQRAVRVPRDPVGEVVIVRRDPRVTLRVIENQMNYAYLGDRIWPLAAENFPIFLEDLRTLASDAFVTPSTLALLEDGPPQDFAFPTSQSLLDYATHRLLWSWYRRDRDRDVGEQRTEN
ncbi:MAG: hypothetical protein JWN86_1956 [Planctomycetota bacterium]|nr:hypothetical protein [Planctomycetota bacterium]